MDNIRNQTQLTDAQLNTLSLQILEYYKDGMYAYDEDNPSRKHRDQKSACKKALVQFFNADKSPMTKYITCLLSVIKSNCEEEKYRLENRQLLKIIKEKENKIDLLSGNKKLPPCGNCYMELKKEKELCHDLYYDTIKEDFIDDITALKQQVERCKKVIKRHESDEINYRSIIEERDQTIRQKNMEIAELNLNPPKKKKMSKKEKQMKKLQEQLKKLQEEETDSSSDESD